MAINVRRSKKSIPELIEKGMRADLHWYPEDVSVSVLAETFAGMANSEGGQVIIGVTPGSGKAHGIEDVDSAVDRCFQAALRTEPPLILPLPQVEQVEDRSLLRIVIPSGLPHIYTFQGRYLGREGRHNNPMPPALLRRKLIERGVVQHEGRVPKRAGMDDLDMRLVQAYAESVHGGADDVEQLLLLRNCVSQVEGELRPTMAGLLLFGKKPQRWAPNALILAARFSGAALSDEFIKQEMVGTLPQQLRQAENFVRENIKSVARIDGLERKETPEYPLEAVRELLVNAVAHRDYSTEGDSIHLFIFSNRLEIHSPGLLPGPVTLSNLLEARFSRNPIIVQVLSDMGFIERLGYGLDRVVKVMADQKLQAPSFQEMAGTFRVTLSNAPTEDTSVRDNHISLQARHKKLGLNPRQEQAIDYIFRNDRITNRDYQDLCPEVHAETLRRDLADLVKKQVLLKIGSKRGTHYILKDTSTN